MSTPIAYMRHIRQEKICAGGARVWFAQYGFSWVDFLENGIPAEKLAGTGDQFAIRVANNALKEFQNGG